ncbi:hypothetical protein [Parasitella parasitica]|uniref:Uncharacterized protein n=1 Tax=Parasitella parasitica TaxID=35722 RepID=A0A0B7NIB2_9FUNG|nr:hypothetical protein [Parasitella parasitica]
MFSLLPLYNCKANSIQFDQQEFWRIMHYCGKTNQDIKDSIPKEKNDETLRSCHSQMFDFSKLGFKSKQDLSNDKRLFWNLMQTNGYSVEFTFKKKPAKKSTIKPLAAANSGDASKKERIRTI